MADLRRAEKLALAKKKLKQFQQKNRDSQSESGRSTPTKKKLEEEDGAGKIFQIENGGSTCSLSQSENLSSNISDTESPVPALDNICHIFNGNSQPDILNVSNTFNTLPKVSEDLFKAPSPRPLFPESSINGQSVSDFFDNLSSSNKPPDRSSHMVDNVQDEEQIPNPLLNLSTFHPPIIKASTPDTPWFQDTPNYSFPDASVSSIEEVKNNVSGKVVGDDLELKLKNCCAKNEDLEQQLTEQKVEIVKLQSHLEDMKKKADEEAFTLKHHVQAIEILVSEKTELQNTLEKQQEQFDRKAGEVEELQGRLRASRHRVSELERELGTAKSQVQTLDSSIREVNGQRAALIQQSDYERKRIGDLELTVSDLQSKLENQDQAINMLRTEVDKKTSELSLAEVRIQQLSGDSCVDGGLEDELRLKNEELSKTVCSLESQLKAATEAKEESITEYQRYVNRLHTELQELKTVHEASKEQCRDLAAREQQLVQQMSELERQLNRVPQTLEDPALREQLRKAEESNQTFQIQLQQKANEVDCLREGLQERALRIQELEEIVDRLEAERPDSANLQAAIESDKVAASRAVAQNNNLKKQLEELEEALVKLSNNKLELTQQLQHEQHLSRDLTEKLERIQESKTIDVNKAQQTEGPVLQESEVQTATSEPVVSPEAMAKLEDKFRKTMSELADLSDEKQRLEHLVLQLQSETETIGEYITLYQIQRGMLRQRAQEKDEQVAKLAEDKEALRNKLMQLNCLVQRLVGGNHRPELHNYVTEQEEAPETSHSLELPNVQEPTTKLETAELIRSLLTEIGANNLVMSTVDNTAINFHPCPWCSGRLITV